MIAQRMRLRGACAPGAGIHVKAMDAVLRNSLNIKVLRHCLTY